MTKSRWSVIKIKSSQTLINASIQRKMKTRGLEALTRKWIFFLMFAVIIICLCANSEAKGGRLINHGLFRPLKFCGKNSGHFLCAKISWGSFQTTHKQRFGFRDSSRFFYTTMTFTRHFHDTLHACSEAKNKHDVSSVSPSSTSFPGSSLFLPRESTLVAAGHVSARFLQIPKMWLKGGAGKL